MLVHFYLTMFLFYFQVSMHDDIDTSGSPKVGKKCTTSACVLKVVLHPQKLFLYTVMYMDQTLSYLN